MSDIGDGEAFPRSAIQFFALLAAIIVPAYFFLDRQLAEALRPQLAEALRPHLAGERLFVWLTYIVNPFAGAASIAAVIVSAMAFRRGALGACKEAVLRVCCAILIAGVLTFQLKGAFGRTWPETWVNNNPSFFGNGTYGFFPFHGGAGYASFPSGHMTAASAFAGAV